jgi:hypothetical protein
MPSLDQPVPGVSCQVMSCRVVSCRVLSRLALYPIYHVQAGGVGTMLLLKRETREKVAASPSSLSLLTF